MNHSLKAPFDLGKICCISLAALSIWLPSGELKSNQITARMLGFTRAVSTVVHQRSNCRPRGGQNLEEENIEECQHLNNIFIRAVPDLEFSSQTASEYRLSTGFKTSNLRCLKTFLRLLWMKFKTHLVSIQARKY